MEVKKKSFPKIMNENEKVYFQHVFGVIESSDELSCVQITKTPNYYAFRIAPSIPKYTNLIIEELFRYHNLLGIKLDMGKSIKTNAVITFTVQIN